jgi:hypothetical protein
MSVDDFEREHALLNPEKDLKGVDTNLPKHMSMKERRLNIIKARDRARGVLDSRKKTKEH